MSDSVVVAVVGSIGALALVNLLLSFGIIRRLREITAQAAGQEPAGGLGPSMPVVGTSVPPFRVTTNDDEVMTEANLAGMPAYVGFFTATCTPCREQLPAFVEVLRSVDPERVLVVIGDTGGAPADVVEQMVGQVTGRARVVVEVAGTLLADTFGVDRFPTMLAVDNGAVTATVHIAERLPVLSHR